MATTTPPNVPKDRISEAAGYGRSGMEPGRDAWELLRQVWMTKGPTVITLPVDPVKISRQLGIEVLFDDELPVEVSGVLRKEAGFADPQIFLNPLDTHSRRRFACAHALGHYSRNVEVGREQAWKVVDGRDFFSSSDLDIEESYATEFAAELLMPRIVLRELLDTQGVVTLASHLWRHRRCHELRLGRIGVYSR